MDANEKPLEPHKAMVKLPMWSIVSGMVTVIVVAVSVMSIIYNMRDAIASNIMMNNANQQEQMALLKQIVCQNRWQLYHGRKPSAEYRGECDR